MEKIFSKTSGLTDKPFTYCPGCPHGTIHRLVGECLEELGMIDNSVAIASVGCSVMSYDNFACNSVQASHGRAPAVATGLKRTNPDKMVFTYQGDGDFASIGMGEAIHAAGYKTGSQIGIAMDAANSELWNAKEKKYIFL